MANSNRVGRLRVSLRHREELGLADGLAAADVDEDGEVGEELLDDGLVALNRAALLGGPIDVGVAEVERRLDSVE